jgi:hypothetical protein
MRYLYAIFRVFRTAALLSVFAAICTCQETSPGEWTRPDVVRSDDSSAKPANTRIFGIIPNNRTYASLQDYSPLTNAAKFRIATEDALDRGTIALAGAFGGLGQLSNSNRSFGQGAAGFGKYFGAAYGDLFIGDYMTEALFPVLLHQDPRYFRRGVGSGWSRLAYAAGQIFWTHRDAGGMQFNYSEILGNSAAVAISNAYYPDHRTAGNAVSKLGMQLGVDMFGNILKEFWPDLQRKFRRSRHLSPGNAKAAGE